MPTPTNTSSDGMVGVYAGEAGNSPEQATNTISDLIRQMKKNFTDIHVEIMPGLEYNQYETLQTIHFYLNSKFESGDVDESGNDRFFHNIVNHRNGHTTKNIDLDTKDIRVTTELENKYWASWLLRMELKDWMRKEKFSLLLNKLAEELPKFGTVVWKKTSYTDDDGSSKVCLQGVDLRDLICDQTSEWLKDSQLVAERIVMSAQQIQEKVETSKWNKEQCDLLLQGLPIKKETFIRPGSTSTGSAYSLTDNLPSVDVYEVWGWVPETYLPDELLKDKKADSTKYEYIMAIVGGVEGGTQNRLLFCEKADPEDFPYKDVHMRKTPGRWLGLGNTELLIPLQIRINELVNRFFMALRLGSVHLFQTRGKLYQKNLLQDAIDGDIIESTHPIDPLATEIRAFGQYQNEVNMIEALADKICNTFEIVTGESMPAATPFRLGAQLGASAAKLFDFVRENCGIFVGDVIRNWVLEDLKDDLDEEHILSLLGSVDELAAFDVAYRKSVLYDQVKTYVIKTGYLPNPEEFQIAEKALSDQMKTGDRKIKVEKAFYGDDFLDTAQIFVDPTGETEDKSAQGETLGNILQIVTSNPMILQDQTARWIIGKIMENSGISPLKIAGFASEPQSPGGPVQAASPASQKFAQNQGDAAPGAPGATQPAMQTQ